MRLATKLILAVFVGTGLILAVDGWYTVHREADFLAEDSRQYLWVVGHALKHVTANVGASGGEAAIQEVLSDVNRGERQVRARWVWLNTFADSGYPQLSGPRLKALLNGDDVFLVRPDSDGKPRLFLFVPIARTRGVQIGALELSASLEPMTQRMWATVRETLILAIVIGLFCGLVAVALGYLMIGRPLEVLTEKMRRIGTGELAGPVAAAGRDELGELARGLNRMCDLLGDARARTRTETEARIAALEQLRHRDRLTTVGRLASGLAHELGTPLNVVSGRASMIARGNLPPDMIAQCANIVRDQCKRMTDIIQKLLDYARLKPPKRTRADLAELAREVCAFLSQLAERQHVELKVTSGGDNCRAEVDRAQIQQVLTNLLMNAIHAMPEGGVAEVTIDRAHAKPPPDQPGTAGACTVIRVADEGNGIKPEDLAHIFEPFFTTKDPGEGTGLGLSIAAGIAREHGGWITAESTVGRGSTFSVYLPVETSQCRDES